MIRFPFLNGKNRNRISILPCCKYVIQCFFYMFFILLIILFFSFLASLVVLVLILNEKKYTEAALT